MRRRRTFDFREEGSPSRFVRHLRFIIQTNYEKTAGVVFSF